MSDDDTRYGITTGSVATAAALAALLRITKNTEIDIVTITAPAGEFNVDILKAEKITDTCGKASAVKKPYPDMDATINAEISAVVELKDTPNIEITGGKGVGIVTKPGLQIPVGESAINPVPRKMIKENIKRHLPKNKGVKITISVPEGEKIALKTMNKRLGIINGISILGTTGIARPMSLEAFKKSNACQLDIAIGQGYKELIFVPGNIGEKLVKETRNVNSDQIIHMSNYPGYMLEQTKERNIDSIEFYGHAGKLIKLAGGIFETKHSTADGRREIMTTHAALCEVPYDKLKEIYFSKTTENMIDILSECKKVTEVFNSIAKAIYTNILERYDIKIRITIVRMDGTILNNKYN
jgi:cobalt-precorrin-5B (C1)-methyltransferase